MENFHVIRIAGLLFSVALANGILTYLVSRSILKQIRVLTQAAREISRGELEFSIAVSSKDELGELALVFEQMRVRLLESRELQLAYEENRKELIANLSHDLRTPMTSIKGYAKGIMDGIASSPEKLEHYMRTIYTHANAMEKMIDELFLYSKLNLQRVPMHFVKVDLRYYFADYVEELTLTLERLGGTISFMANPDDSYVVMADRDQLRRVIENIIQNGLKYMEKENKEIRIRLSACSNQVVAEIEDNGIGIAEESLPHLFDSFYRTDVARNSSTGGSGLGMAIAKQIITAHGGFIGVTSHLGVGTRIFFTLKKGDIQTETGAREASNEIVNSLREVTKFKVFVRDS
jgi:histidine kinase